MTLVGMAMDIEIRKELNKIDKQIEYWTDKLENLQEKCQHKYTYETVELNQAGIFAKTRTYTTICSSCKKIVKERTV
jgi:hypothetical protein